MSSLPYINKLSGSYSKKVSFLNNTCQSHNQVVRRLGKGFSNIKIEYSLKYIALKEAEVTAVENLFGIHSLNTYVNWQSPIDKIPVVYKLPKTWDSDSYITIVNGVKELRTNISFTLVGFIKGLPETIVVPPFNEETFGLSLVLWALPISTPTTVPEEVFGLGLSLTALTINDNKTPVDDQLNLSLTVTSVAISTPTEVNEESVGLGLSLTSLSVRGIENLPEESFAVGLTLTSLALSTPTDVTLETFRLGLTLTALTITYP